VTRRRGWLLVLLVAALVVAGGLAWRLMGARAPAASMATAARPAAPPALEIPVAEILAVRRQPLSQGVAFSGSVRAVNSAFVKARVAGELTQVSVREGDRVRPGQLVAQQDTTEFDWRIRQADQQAQAARAQWEITQRTLANNRALVAQGFISPTALESSASAEAAAQATLQAALAALEIARKGRADAALTAPIGGTVAQRLAQPGERVGVDARILEIVDLSQLEVEAALPPQDVASVRTGQAAQVRIDGIEAPLPARVARVNPSAQAGSRTVAVYLSLEPHPALRHGLFVRGQIQLEQRNVLALPATAVRRDRSRPYVLVLDGPTVRLRDVQTGASGELPEGGDGVEITGGLDDGARVLAGTLGGIADGAAWKPSTVRQP
jgi:RND family efflux transporter MFP subunit